MMIQFADMADRIHASHSRCEPLKTTANDCEEHNNRNNSKKCSNRPRTLLLMDSWGGHTGQPIQFDELTFEANKRVTERSLCAVPLN